MLHSISRIIYSILKSGRVQPSRPIGMRAVRADGGKLARLVVHSFGKHIVFCNFYITLGTAIRVCFSLFN